MNSLFDRLGDMLKNYIEDDQDIFSKPSPGEDSIQDSDTDTDSSEPSSYEDADIGTSYSNTQKSSQSTKPFTSDKKTYQGNVYTAHKAGQSQTDSRQNTNNTQKKTFTFNTHTQQQTHFNNKSAPDHTIYKAPQPVPPQVRKDFDFFGLPLNATLDDCKTVYKRLLKLYHPDKHSSDPARLKTATEYSARVNTAYKRLVEWVTAERTVKG